MQSSHPPHARLSVKHDHTITYLRAAPPTALACRDQFLDDTSTRTTATYSVANTDPQVLHLILDRHNPARLTLRGSYIRPRPEHARVPRPLCSRRIQLCPATDCTILEPPTGLHARPGNASSLRQNETCLRCFSTSTPFLLATDDTGPSVERHLVIRDRRKSGNCSSAVSRTKSVHQAGRGGLLTTQTVLVGQSPAVAVAMVPFHGFMFTDTPIIDPRVPERGMIPPSCPSTSNATRARHAYRHGTLSQLAGRIPTALSPPTEPPYCPAALHYDGRDDGILGRLFVLGISSRLLPNSCL